MKRAIKIVFSIGLISLLSCSEGITPLMKASKNGDITEVSKLIQKGADVDAKDRYGDSALYWAIRCDHPPIVKLLIDNGANTNLAFQRGYTPIISASFYGNLEIVDYLLRNGADPNAVNENGQCALGIAAFNNYERIVKSLLHYNADPNKCNSLYLASGQGNKKIVVLLVSNGASINNKDNAGASPLMAAVENCQFETVKTLLKNGADTKLQNSDGETPLDLALRITENLIITKNKGNKSSSCNSLSTDDCMKIINLLEKSK